MIFVEIREKGNDMKPTVDEQYTNTHMTSSNPREFLCGGTFLTLHQENPRFASASMEPITLAKLLQRPLIPFPILIRFS